MPSSVSALGLRMQEIKAQALSSLMATVDPVGSASKITGNYTGNADATQQGSLRATLVELHPDGRAVLDIPGGRVEVRLPPDLMQAGTRNPNLLKPGTSLLLPADTPARLLPDPATKVALSGALPPNAPPTPSTAVGPAPPLASPFSPGSLGAAIARLTGIAFPAAESAVPPGAAALSPRASDLPAAAPPRQGSAVLPTGLPTALGDALVQASSRQMPLAGALGRILDLTTQTTTDLPASLSTALRALMAQRATPDQLQTASGFQQAVARSGVFLESNLAQATSANPLPPDLKSVLLTLRGQLMALGEAGASDPGSGSATQNAGTMSAPFTSASSRTSHSAGSSVSPELLANLGRASEGALARLKVMQMASLPDHPEIRVTDDRGQPSRVVLAVPIATQGADRPPTAAMGVMIEHHPAQTLPLSISPYEIDREGNREGETFPWKVRIALDLEETGPVQAEIALRGQAVAITLWAERSSMAQSARAEIGHLHEALTGAAFEVLRLEVKEGHPQERPAIAPRLDRKT